MARTARLTKNRHGTFTLRVVIPRALRGPTGRPREVRLSLRTRDLVAARILALRFNLKLEQLKAMTKQNPTPPRGLEYMTLTMGNLKVDINSEEDHRLFQKLLSDNDELRDAMLQAVRTGTAPTGVQQLMTQPAAAGPLNPILLKDAIELYESTRGALNQNRRSTAGEKRRTLDLMRAHLRSTGLRDETLYVHEIRRDQLVAFLGIYANRRGKAALAQEADGAAAPQDQAGGKAEADDADADADERLSARTVVKAIGHLSNFFIFAVAQNWAGANPVDDPFLKAMEGLKKAASKDRNANSYELFSQEELRRVFDPAAYLRGLNAADEFWAPLIALFTGARLGEIVLLEVASIGYDDEHGVHLIDIKDAKNQNSVRKVPVPSQLIDLGFLDYCDHVRGLGATLLFPHRPLNATRKNDPSKHVSRAFGEHLDAIGIDSPSKVFHSLRHTVITYLHVNGVPVREAELIVGHAAQEMHARIGAVTPGGGSSQTHLNTYINTSQFSTSTVKLYMRLKLHMDRALGYDLDVIGLREAARIVQDRTVKRKDDSFASGWHTNAKATAAAMLARLAKAAPSTSQTQQAD